MVSQASQCGVRRRSFLTGAVGLGVLGFRQPQQIDSLAGKGATGSLHNPSVVQARPRATIRDNDEFIKSVERRLRCTCGCNLDVYTCRTTDFSCQTSPAMHRQILAMQDAGQTVETILADFVREHGEQVLMAPKAEGFNWVGYLLPGTLIAAIGTWLLFRLARRREAISAATAQPMRHAGGVGGQGGATAEEQEWLRRALADTER